MRKFVKKHKIEKVTIRSVFPEVLVTTVDLFIATKRRSGTELRLPAARRSGRLVSRSQPVTLAVYS